jgi:hypothetical protein
MFPARLLALLVFSTSVAGRLADDIVHAFEGAVDCGGCHALLLPLQGLAYLGDSVFSDTIISVCKVLRVSPVLHENRYMFSFLHGSLKTRTFVKARSPNRLLSSHTT